MSENKGSGIALAAGAVLSVPFAIVPAAVLLLTGSEEEAECAPGEATQAFTVSGEVPQVDGFNAQQLETAAIIMKVAVDKKLPYEAQVIGLMTAMQESTLGVNTQPTGEGRDAGPFQQRTLPGWYGTEEQVQDVAYAAERFFLGHDITETGPEAAGPEGYHIPGLVDVFGWQHMAPTVAAQTVQGSNHPDAYAKHQRDAERIIAALAGVEVVGAAPADLSASSCTPSTTVANGDVQAVIDRAKSIIGTTYDFGGGSMDGPGPGGIDCSAFVAYAWTAAGYRDLPRMTQDQFDFLAAYPVDVASIQPGDLIYEAWGRTGPVGSPDGISHVTMYIGNDQVIEASRSAMEVRISPTRFNDPAFVGIRRIPATGGDENS